VKWPKEKWSFCNAEDLPRAPFYLPLAAALRDDDRDESINETLAALVGWFVAEGSFVSSGIAISQAQDTDEATEIERILAALGIEYSVQTSKPGGKGGKLFTNSYYIGVRKNRELTQWIRSECGDKSASRRIPDCVVRGSDAVKSAFLISYLRGDGHFSARKTWHAMTTSQELRDQLQRISIELGFSCCWASVEVRDENHSPRWDIHFSRETRNSTSIHIDRSVSRVPYSGDVWCLTVPSGAYVTRRNGRASISGNSAHFANKADLGVVVARKATGSGTTVLVKKIRYQPDAGTIGSFDFDFDRKMLIFREAETAEDGEDRPF
jgi:hypothetical protein